MPIIVNTDNLKDFLQNARKIRLFCRNANASIGAEILKCEDGVTVGELETFVRDSERIKRYIALRKDSKIPISFVTIEQHLHSDFKERSHANSVKLDFTSSDNKKLVIDVINDILNQNGLGHLTWDNVSLWK